MSDFQQRVAARFDSAAATYDNHSTVQRHAAARLASLIATASLPPRPRVLEIGCGTGHLTERLACHLPGAHILATDIAPAMVAACRQRLAHHPRIEFAVMDACRPHQLGGSGSRRPASADFFDLICANLAVQWFADLPAALAGLVQRLAPGGVLALSLLGAETFREWRAAHERLGLRAGTQALRTYVDYADVFPQTGTLHMSSELWVDQPGSALDFLRGLRAIGADTPVAGHAPLSATAMRRVLRSLGTPVITYELIYSVWLK